MATLYRCLIAANGIEGPDWFQTQDSLIKPGYVVQRGDEGKKIAIAPTDCPYPLGVADCPSYHDLNTVFTATHQVPVWLCGSGVDINVLHDNDVGETTLIAGEKFVVDAANAGCVKLWAYGDNNVQTDTMSGLVGRLLYDVTIVGDVATFIPLKLSL